jgi:hypothetical protein
MFQSIHTWFSSVDWINKDMWGMFGQWAGAIATFIAVMVALKQTKISQDQTKYSQKQAETALQQMEEARQKEIEASKPELMITANTFFEDNIKYICLYINNIKKDVHLTIHNHFLHQHFLGDHLQRIRNISETRKLIETKRGEIKKIQFGDVLEIKIPLVALISTVQPQNQALFTYCIYTTIGAKFECSLLINLQETNIENSKMWVCYFTQKIDLEIDEIIDEEKVLEAMDTETVEYELERYKKRKNPN